MSPVLNYFLIDLVWWTLGLTGMYLIVRHELRDALLNAEWKGVATEEFEDLKSLALSLAHIGKAQNERIGDLENHVFDRKLAPAKKSPKKSPKVKGKVGAKLTNNTKTPKKPKA